LVTAIVTASHERAAEFRERMLNAADDFSTAAIVVLQQVREVASEIKGAKEPLVDGMPPSFKPEIKTLLDQANKAVDDVFAKQARVHLLFGDESRTTIASVGCLRTYGTCDGARSTSRLDNDHAQMVLYSRNFSGAQEQSERFNSAALVQIEETWFDRPWRRWSRRIRLPGDDGAGESGFGGQSKEA
jgi:hypothetical protein